VPPYLD